MTQVIHNTPEERPFDHSAQCHLGSSGKADTLRCMDSQHNIQGNTKQDIAASTCLVANTESEKQNLLRRYKAGTAIRLHRGIYAPTDIWNGLNPQEQSRQLALALSHKYPDWVFAGLSAAAIHGLHYRGWLHHDHRIYICGSRRNAVNKRRRIQHVYTPKQIHTKTNGLPVTPVARTLIDCALLYDFRDVLAMFDSALRQQLTTKEELAETFSVLEPKHNKRLKSIPLLIQLASPLSESVGESLCRGTMLEAGFPAPHLQVEHTNPYRRGHVFRTDFEFTLPDRSTVIVEFDGMEKYVNTDMTRNRNLRAVVHEEQIRERALLNERNVRQIIRFDYDQVMSRTPVIRALDAAGIPRNNYALVGPKEHASYRYRSLEPTNRK